MSMDRCAKDLQNACDMFELYQLIHEAEQDIQEGNLVGGEDVFSELKTKFEY